MDNKTRRYVNVIADRIRKAYDIVTPIDNMEDIVHKLGGTVEEKTDFDDLDDGTIRKKDENSFVIVIPPFQNEQRKAFRIAQELGHLFLHMGFKTDNECWSTQNQTIYRQFRTTEQEYQANEFAAALFMPKNEYRQVLDLFSQNNRVDVNKVAKYFNVSVSAAVTRGQFLGYLIAEKPDIIPEIDRSLLEKAERKTNTMIKIPEITSAELLNRLETALYSNEELEHSQHFQTIKNMEVNPDDIDSDLQGPNPAQMQSLVIWTDDSQCLIDQIDDTIFRFGEVRAYLDQGENCLDPDKKYLFCVDTIDLNTYIESKMEDIVSMFYKGGIEEVRNTYDGSANQIIAECLFELESAYEVDYFETGYVSEDEAKKALLEYAERISGILTPTTDDLEYVDEDLDR